MSALYDDTSDVEEAENVDARDRKGVASSVTSPQGNIPRLPFFKKVTIVIVLKKKVHQEIPLIVIKLILF